VTPLGLIAGSGPLPFEVFEAARARGVELAIAAIDDNTDPRAEALGAHAFRWFNAGELGALIEFLHTAGAREVMLAGAVSKRRILKDPGALRPDARALALLARLGAAGGRGDDALLRALAGELEADGLRVIDSTRYLADRLTALGPIAGPPASRSVEADARLGMQVIAALGLHDVGQAVLVKDGTVLAVEAVEGTDAMLRRGSEYAAHAVLVKAAKPRQDMRFDVPVIGPGTLELAAECQVAAIALEAGRTLILERARTLAAAERCGVSLFGVEGAPA
jgi:UDP-2,3-diacylglucosamine hydrolase